jgi:anti-anti-sigma regulatory factor
MHASDQTAGEATVLVALPERLTISEAAELQQALQDAVATGRPIAIDGSQVAEIDTAGLQLLIVLWRSHMAGVAACAWRGVSEPLVRSATLIGVHELLWFPGGNTGNSGNVPA